MKINALIWSLAAGALTLLVCFHYSRRSEQPHPEQAARNDTLPVAFDRAPIRPAAFQSPPQARAADADEEGGEDDELARELWEIHRHGFHLGVAPDAYAKAMKQRLRMEAVATQAMAVARGLGAPTPTWTFIGPMPMKGQKANFGGNLFGPAFDAAGRVSAIAIDPSGNIYVGAASGGVFLSKDGGSTFT
jgi:hypothetical protein